jgi:hypothetical protein
MTDNTNHMAAKMVRSAVFFDKPILEDKELSGEMSCGVGGVKSESRLVKSMGDTIVSFENLCNGKFGDNLWLKGSVCTKC